MVKPIRPLAYDLKSNGINNLGFGFISPKSREISDEIFHFSSKGIAEGTISEKKNGKDRGKVLDFERIEPKTHVNRRAQAVFLSVVLLFFCGCSRSSNWASNQIDVGDEKYNSTRISYYAPNPINGIDLEFLRTPSRLLAYLNVHSLPIPSTKEDPKAVAVDLLIEEEKYHFAAYRYEGGQRLLLPEDMVDLIIKALIEKKPLQIKVPGYFTRIEPKGFEDKFEKMQQKAVAKIPFHSPF
jgi:hypothetical protein